MDKISERIDEMNHDDYVPEIGHWFHARFNSYTLPDMNNPCFCTGLRSTGRRKDGSLVVAEVMAEDNQKHERIFSTAEWKFRFGKVVFKGESKCVNQQVS